MKQAQLISGRNIVVERSKVIGNIGICPMSNPVVVFWEDVPSKTLRWLRYDLFKKKYSCYNFDLVDSEIVARLV
jgi:hypothetical protein